MLETFKLVHGAVSTKDIVPVLKHFAYKDARLFAFDGRVSISAPAPELKHLDTFTVPATLMLAALQSCKGQASLLTKDQRVIVSDGASTFIASLPTGSIDAFPLPPKPERIKKVRNGFLLDALRRLRPFIGDDASRPFCATVYFKQDVAYATNNVVLARVELPAAYSSADFALPMFAIDELLRIGLEPEGFVLEADHAVTFVLPNKCWVRSTLLDSAWPDAEAALLAAMTDAHFTPVGPAIVAAIEQVEPFVDPHHPAIVFDNDTITCRSAESSARVSGFENLGQGMYHPAPLSAVVRAAAKADWSRFPRVPWCSEDGALAGVLVGIRS